MIYGRLGNKGELLFEIELIASNGDIIIAEVMLDTGFTAGYLAVNSQDVEALGWSCKQRAVQLETAQGVGEFSLYEGRVIIDGREFVIPVHVGEDLPETLIGVQWLSLMRLVVDPQQRMITLEYLEGGF